MEDTLIRAETASLSGVGAIDCDVHPRSPGQADLLPFVSSYWKEMLEYRSIDSLELTSAPVSIESYAEPEAKAAVRNAAALSKALLDPNGLAAAILTLVNGAQALTDPYLAAAICEATNRWIAAEWLDRDPRLRASLLVPFQHPEAAAAEIRRVAGDHRFVSVLAIAMGERPLGKRANWPIYRAASEAGFALSIHPGSAYRHAPTQAGFPSYLIEEAVQESQGFASQLASLLSEGVLTEFPDMKVVMAGSGVSWLFGVSWRMAKDWRGARVEVPWIKESPEKLFERQLRLTIQPFDGPADVEGGAHVMDFIGSPEMLLYSSDFPRRREGAAGAWPASLPTDAMTAICRDNPLATFSRLEV